MEKEAELTILRRKLQPREPKGTTGRTEDIKKRHTRLEGESQIRQRARRRKMANAFSLKAGLTEAIERGTNLTESQKKTAAKVCGKH